MQLASQNKSSLEKIREEKKRGRRSKKPAMQESENTISVMITPGAPTETSPAETEVWSALLCAKLPVILSVMSLVHRILKIN